MLLSLFALYQSVLPPQTHSAPPRITKSINRQLPWNGHFSAKSFTTSRTDNLRLSYIKKQLQKTIITLPTWHTENLDKIEVRNQSNISRGLSNSNKIILHTNSIDSTDELKSVFIHEMGHIVDLGALQGNRGRKTKFKDGKRSILSDDPSVRFYQISWTSAKKRRQNSTTKDFVSGYARTDCFEDFAESYLLYRLHGEKFRHIAQESQALQKKYIFLKTQVFDGREFNLTKTATNFTPSFDTTLLSLNK